MEKVIVVSTDLEDGLFVKCFEYENDEQLQRDVENYIGASVFYVIYEEDVDDLEEALEDMFAPPPRSKKLSSDDVKTIQMMVESGDFKIKEIAANYGVSRQTIWRVSKGI